MNRSEAHHKLVNELITAMTATGLCRVWKQHTGVAYRGGRTIAFGKKGSADISGILNNGIRIEVECKTGTGRQTPEQRSFGEMINSMGGIYLVARDISSVLEVVQAAVSVRPTQS